MARKDWKKTRDGTGLNDTGRVKVYKKKDGSFVKIREKMINNDMFPHWYVQTKVHKQSDSIDIFSDEYDGSFGKRFKIKSKALKYAKAYMKSH